MSFCYFIILRTIQRSTNHKNAHNDATSIVEMRVGTPIQLDVNNSTKIDVRGFIAAQKSATVVPRCRKTNTTTVPN